MRVAHTGGEAQSPPAGKGTQCLRQPPSDGEKGRWHSRKMGEGEISSLPIPYNLLCAGHFLWEASAGWDIQGCLDKVSNEDLQCWIAELEAFALHCTVPQHIPAVCYLFSLKQENSQLLDNLLPSYKTAPFLWQIDRLNMQEATGFWAAFFPRTWEHFLLWVHSSREEGGRAAPGQDPEHRRGRNAAMPERREPGTASACQAGWESSACITQQVWRAGKDLQGNFRALHICKGTRGKVIYENIETQPSREWWNGQTHKKHKCDAEPSPNWVTHFPGECTKWGRHRIAEVISFEWHEKTANKCH